VRAVRVGGHGESHSDVRKSGGTGESQDGDRYRWADTRTI
jgi:hypothetical protein